MEKEFEERKPPEIKTDELLKVLESIEFEDYEGIHFNGTDFLLLLDTEEEVDPESPATYKPSTAIDGYDIYIDETLSGKERDRALFHEILEANLLDQELSLDEAHEIAKEETQKTFYPKEKRKN